MMRAMKSMKARWDRQTDTHDRHVLSWRGQDNCKEALTEKLNDNTQRRWRGRWRRHWRHKQTSSIKTEHNENIKQLKLDVDDKWESLCVWRMHARWGSISWDTFLGQTQQNTLDEILKLAYQVTREIFLARWNQTEWLEVKDDLVSARPYGLVTQTSPAQRRREREGQGTINY